MKILAVFLLSVLGWSLAEGMHVSKCELKGHLRNAFNKPLMKTTLNVPNVDDLVAKIVCNTEVGTGFNTNSVKEMIPGMADHGHHGGNSGQDMPKHRRRRSNMSPLSHNVPSHQPCTLHGIFQMPSHLVCDDGVTSSLNICGMSCSKLHDGNIEDDILCLLKVTTTLGDSFFGVKTWEHQGGVMKSSMEKKCETVQASKYFVNC